MEDVFDESLNFDTSGVDDAGNEFLLTDSEVADHNFWKKVKIFEILFKVYKDDVDIADVLNQTEQVFVRLNNKSTVE